MGGRVAIKVHGAVVEKTLGAAGRLKVDGVIDSIAGATPTGQPAPAGSTEVPLSTLTERREAWNAVYAHQFAGVNVAAGAGNSRESDYVSDGWSLNTLSEFNQKNTTLLLGIAGTSDEVRVFHQKEWERKRSLDLIAGITQLLDPRASVTANLSWGRASGYLADPYKLVQKNTEVIPGVFLPLTFPENRPAEREKWIVFLATIAPSRSRRAPSKRVTASTATRTKPAPTRSRRLGSSKSGTNGSCDRWRAFMIKAPRPFTATGSMARRSPPSPDRHGRTGPSIPPTTGYPPCKRSPTA